MIPENYEKNIRQAVEILKEAGCREIFLFGSLAENRIRKGSDIDIAVRGCPKGKFFHVLGKLLQKLDVDVDLVDLDENDSFPRYLIQNERFVKIG
ncbi:MAG: nucleotidyltransferase domain-containing protein [Desulfobacterales bacterium]